MIDFELSEDQRLAQSAIQDFARAEILPRARAADMNSRLDDEALDALWATGILQTQVFDDLGSRSPVMNAIVFEELAAADISIALAVAAPMAFAQAVYDHGTARQKGELLPQFAGPQFQRAAMAMMEPVFGVSTDPVRTHAWWDGNGWIIAGRKTLVPFGERCEQMLVTALTERGPRVFIVDARAQGVRLERKYGTLGLRALELGDLHLDQVRVPPGSELGGDEGCDLLRLRCASDAAMSAMYVGLGRAVLEHTIPYVKDRVVHGTALARKQVIAFRIADMHTHVNAMRWMAWQAAWALETSRDWSRLCRLAHLFCAEKVISIADEGVQAFGGHGFVKAEPIEMWYRNAAAATRVSGLAGV